MVSPENRGGQVYRDIREKDDGTFFDFSDGISDAELSSLPDGLLLMWGDIFYDNWRCLEVTAWDKLEAMGATSVMRWATLGDWNALADYIERGDKITPEIGSFIAKILRDEVKRPGKPITLAKARRDFEIVKWVRTERANGKSRAAALEGAAAKFNLAYDTIDDIFDAALATYRKHLVQEKDLLAPIAHSWRGLRAVAPGV